MLGHLLRPDLEELIEKRDFNTLRSVFITWAPPDIAELIGQLPDALQGVIFRLLPRNLAADTFASLDLPAQMGLLKSLGKEEVASVLNDLSPDDRTAFFEELPANVTRQLLESLTSEERATAQKLLGYPPDSVGRLMTPEFTVVSPEDKISDVIQKMRERVIPEDNLSFVYVVDQDGKIVDDLPVQRLLLAVPGRYIKEVMDRHFVALQATDAKTKAVETFRKYNRVALPVTDSKGQLVGMVTLDDVLAVTEEVTTAQFHHVGGVTSLDAPYMRTPFFEMVRKRASWLVILFLGEMLTATAMGHYEAEIQKAVVLALFIPLIISSGGNSGSQATTLIIRALALGQVRLRDWWRVMRREVPAGLALGIILGGIGFLRIALWSAFSDVYGPHWLIVAVTVALALVGVVLWGTLAGSMLPLLLRRCGVDPATASAPFIATLVDVTGLIIYFSVAEVVMHGHLL